MESGEKYKPIGTKVSPEAWRALNVVAESLDVKIYNLLQVVLNAFLKTFATDDVQSDYVKKVVRDFLDVQKAKDGFCLCAPQTTKNELQASKCLVFVEKKDKKLPEVLLVRSGADDLTLIGNEDAILTEFLQAFSPSTLSLLKRIKDEEKQRTLTGALKYAVAEATPHAETISDEVRSLFAENRYFEKTPNANVSRMKEAVVNVDDLCPTKRTRRRKAELVNFEQDERRVSSDIYEREDFVPCPLEADFDAETEN